MKALYNETGLHNKGKQILARVDLVPDTHDKTFPMHYVDHFMRPPTDVELANPTRLAMVPTFKAANPALCHFIRISETSTLGELTDYICRIFDRDTVASLDSFLTMPDSAHLVSPLMRRRNTLSMKPMESRDPADVLGSLNSRYAGLVIPLSPGGNINPVQPQTIDVGSPATDRAGFRTVAGNTSVYLTNPANEGGVVDTVEIWLTVAATAMKVGMFYLVSGTTYYTRDGESVGAVAAGSKQTLTVTLTTVAGDMIGLYDPSCRIESDIIGGSGYLYVSGDYCDPGDQAVYNTAGVVRLLSLHGTGGAVAAGRGWWSK